MTAAPWVPGPDGELRPAADVPMVTAPVPDPTKASSAPSAASAPAASPYGTPTSADPYGSSEPAAPAPETPAPPAPVPAASLTTTGQMPPTAPVSVVESGHESARNQVPISAPADDAFDRPASPASPTPGSPESPASAPSAQSGAPSPAEPSPADFAASAPSSASALDTAPPVPQDDQRSAAPLTARSGEDVADPYAQGSPYGGYGSAQPYAPDARAGAPTQTEQAATLPSASSPAAPVRPELGYTVRLTFSDGSSMRVASDAVLGRKPQRIAEEEQLIPVALLDPLKSSSRVHLRMRLSTEGVSVEDAGSGNGTRVEHEGRLYDAQPGQPFWVVPGDTVWLGEVPVVIELG
jgi:hypothetical protein